MIPEHKAVKTPAQPAKKPAASPRERERREQEWSDRDSTASHPERESYRDGSSVNECWNRKNY